MRDLDYNKDGTVRLPKWTGNETILWMKRVLRAYLKEKWCE